MLKLFRYLKPYTIPIIFILVFTGVQVVTSLLLPDFTSDIINEGVLKQNIPVVWAKGLQMLGVAVISMAANITAVYFSSQMSSGFGRDVRGAVFTKVENLALQDISDLSTASLITRTTNDVQQVQMVTQMLAGMAISAPITAVMGLVLAFQKQRTLSIVFLVAVPLLLVSVLLLGNIAVPLFQKVQGKVDKLNLVFRETLTGVRVIRAYNNEDIETHKVDDANTDLMRSSLKVNNLISLMMPFIMILMSITRVVIIWYSSKFVDAGTMLPGDIFAFVQYAMQIMFAFTMLAVVYIVVPRAEASAERINEVLDKHETIADPVQPVGFTPKRALHFKDVTFCYPGAEKPVLENLNFSVEEGQMLAIIGGTGSGKSTLLNLIPRFYDISSGSIEFNDVDIRDVKQETLRENIGYVPQKNILFSGTIADNLRFGKEDATTEDMERATSVAQASEFIKQKEDGFNSLVEQEGKNFSGGQKQRLAIARAIIRKPELYLFDDSFSALDLKTDAKLRAALQKETKQAIVLIVSQRISTIKNADIILVLDEGKIEAQGTHTELLKKSKVYREIALSQLSEEELA